MPSRQLGVIHGAPRDIQHTAGHNVREKSRKRRQYVILEHSREPPDFLSLCVGPRYPVVGNAALG